MAELRVKGLGKLRRELEVHWAVAKNRHTAVMAMFSNANELQHDALKLLRDTRTSAQALQESARETERMVAELHREMTERQRRLEQQIAERAMPTQRELDAMHARMIAGETKAITRPKSTRNGATPPRTPWEL